MRLSNTTLRFIVAAVACLASCAAPAAAQVQLAATSGALVWDARARGAAGNGVSILTRVYSSPASSSGTLVVGVGDDAASGLHSVRIDSSGGVSVQAVKAPGTTRTTSYTNTLTEGRWYWLAARIPANYFGGGSVDAQLWLDVDGTWTAATVSSTGADPGGTIANTGGQVSVTNGLNAACVVAPLWIWSGVDAPDTAAEFRAVALGSTAPDAYTGLVFAATLRDDSTDTYGVDVTAGTSTGTTWASQSGLPSWSGVRHHRLVDIDPSRETSLGILSSITNRALTGNAWTAPTAMVGGEIVDTPYGQRAAYLGEDGGVNTNRAWEAPASGPIVHNRYCTIVYVFGAQSGPGGTAWNLFATGATDLQLQLLGLGRFGFNSNITDATHRATATPSVFVAKSSDAPMEHWHGTFGKVTHGSFNCGNDKDVPSPGDPAGGPTPTSGTMRLGTATGSTTTVARIWLSRFVLFEGHLTDTEVDEVIASLGAWHGCRHYTAGVSRLIAGEGQSSLAGTWDSHAKGGALHRIAGLAPRTTIVFNSATGGQTFTNHNADRDATVSHYAVTLCPAAAKKTFIGQMGSNDLNVVTPSGSTVLTSLGSYLNGNASSGGTVGNAISTLYDRIVMVKISPRYADTATQADFAAQVAVLNAGLAGTSNVDRVLETYFTNFGAGGDWSNNATYYWETPNGVHLDDAGHDLYWSTVWRGQANNEFAPSTRRRVFMRPRLTRRERGGTIPGRKRGQDRPATPNGSA